MHLTCALQYNCYTIEICHAEEPSLFVRMWLFINLLYSAKISQAVNFTLISQTASNFPFGRK